MEAEAGRLVLWVDDSPVGLDARELGLQNIIA